MKLLSKTHKITYHPMTLGVMAGICLIVMFGWPITSWGQTTDDVVSTNALSNGSFIVRLEVMEKVAVSPKRPGFLAQTTLTPGTLIEKGTIIAELDHSQEELEVQKLEAEVTALQEQANNTSEITKAEKTIDAAQFRVDELQSISQETRIPKLELVEAKTELATAQASLEDATSKWNQAKHSLAAKQVELKIAKLNLEKSFVKAPFDGVVFKQFKHAGEALTQGEAIAEVYRLDYLLGTVLLKQEEVPTSLLPMLTGEVTLESPNSEAKTYYFENPKVLPRIERDGRYLAVIEIKNKKTQSPAGLTWELLPGMQGHLVVRGNTKTSFTPHELRSPSTPSSSLMSPLSSVPQEVHPGATPFNPIP